MSSWQGSELYFAINCCRLCALYSEQYLLQGLPVCACGKQNHSILGAGHLLSWLLLADASLIHVMLFVYRYFLNRVEYT